MTRIVPWPHPGAGRTLITRPTLAALDSRRVRHLRSPSTMEIFTLIESTLRKSV
jgi:hypothetical protein